MWWSDDLATPDSITWTSASKGIEEMVCTDMTVPPGGKPIVTLWDRTAFRVDNPDIYNTVQIPAPTFSSGWSLAYQSGHPEFVVLTAYRHNWWYGAGDLSGWSDDGGLTWHDFESVTSGTQPADMRFGDVAVSCNDANNIVRVPEADILPYYTLDRGSTWQHSTITYNGQPVDGGGYSAYYVHKEMLVADPSQDGTFLLYQWEYGLFRSTDGGRNFMFLSSGVPAWRWHPCLKAVDDKPGHFWFGPGEEDAGRGPLMRSTDGGLTWSPVTTIDAVSVVGFGKGAAGVSYPAIYVEGVKGSQEGIYRSTDEGATWDLLTIHPLGIWDRVTAICGDMRIFGRVYVAFAGNSCAYGQQFISGDINRDGYVNVGDLQALVAAWASQETPPSDTWNGAADCNGDGHVNVGDLQVLVGYWGQQLR